MINSFTLSFEAADILSEDMRANLRQFPFEIPHTGATRQERGQTRNTVWADLERRGLADRGRQEPELEQALHLLNRPDIGIAITSVETKTEHVYRARIAHSGRVAVLAVQRDNALSIEFIDPRGLTRICAGLLPAEPAGRLEGATVPVAAATARTADEDDEDTWLTSSPTTSRKAGTAENTKAQRIFALPVHRVGYIHVTGSISGQPRRTPAIGWRDTTEGRFSVTTRSNHDGQQWNTFAGADETRIVRYLSEQLAAFQDPR